MILTGVTDAMPEGSDEGSEVKQALPPVTQSWALKSGHLPQKCISLSDKGRSLKVASVF